MRLQTKIAVPHSVVFVMDRRHGKTPNAMSDQLVAATSSCIAIGSRPDSDGATLIVLRNEEQDIAKTLFLLFDDTIETPKHDVSVCTALDEKVPSLGFDSERCRVRVWLNDEKNPDHIEIELGLRDL